jgi:hypothetical protein
VEPTIVLFSYHVGFLLVDAMCHRECECP